MIDDILRILQKGCFCDNCLGRFYYGLVAGYSNAQKGRAIRTTIAMMIDGKQIDYSKIDSSNFNGFKFKVNKDFIAKPKEKCFLCGGIFESIDELSKKAAVKLEGIEFKNFSVGSSIPTDVMNREEELWEMNGIEYVESIKFDLNRETRSSLSELIKKPVEFDNPDIIVLYDFTKMDVEIKSNAIYVLGHYQKLKRGIPQSKWGTPGKYKTSVQEIVAKPIMKLTKGKDNAFHGFGREDVDARCLGWRPFVIEITEPIVRTFDLKKMEKAINKNKGVRIKLMRFTDKTTVRRIKTEMGDKTYRVTVVFSKPVKASDLRKIKSLAVQIKQRTPVRVAHRRADLVRTRLVKAISYKRINDKVIILTVKGTSGLYIKELVHGDQGRTNPSIAGILGVEAKPKDLDVIKIEGPKDL